MEPTTRDDEGLISLEVRQHRAAGERLFLEGEAPAGVYFLHAGQVELSFAARNGRGKSLRILNSGEILGLTAFVMRSAHDCSAIARTRCDIGFIDSEELLRLLHDSPGLWLSVLRLLSNNVNAVYDEMRALGVG